MRVTAFDAVPRTLRKAGRTGLVLLSAAIVASMVATVAFGPLGGQVQAQDGYGRRDRDAGSIIAALFSAPADTAQRRHGGSPSGWRWSSRSRFVEPDPSPRHVAAISWRAPHGRVAAAGPVVRRPVARPTQVSDAVAPGVKGGEPGQHAVCVRLCDGFYFPMGDIAGQGEVDSRTALCSGLCPGAPTRLFVTPGDPDDMSRATSVSTGEAYPGLAVAFAHTREVGPTCACHAPGGDSAAISPLTDFTLRSGDSIMTPIGWRVFQGSGRWPYRRDDFRSIRSARNITSGLRATLATIEDASLGRRFASRLPPLVVTRRIHVATSGGASAAPVDAATQRPADAAPTP